MKFKIIPVCLSFMVLMAPMQTYAGDTSNLEGAWLLDEESGTRVDETANNNDLTDNNTVLFAAGQFGNAADVEFSNTEYLSITDGSQTNLTITSTVSIVSWVKFESLSSAIGNQVIAGKGNIATPKGYSFRTDTATNKFKFQGDTSSFLSTATHGTGTFIHAAVTADTVANELVYIIDGSAETTQTFNDGLAGDTADFRIGINSGSTQAGFDGLIDEVAVFSRILTTAEVNDLKDNGITAFISGAPRRRVMIFIAFKLWGLMAHYTGQWHSISIHRTKFNVKKPLWMKFFHNVANFKFIPKAYAAEDFGSVNREVDNRYTQIMRVDSRQVDVYDGPKGTGYIITLYKTIDVDEYQIQKHTGPEVRDIKTTWTLTEE